MKGIYNNIMVKNEYQCPRCEYSSVKKQHMENHFKRKKICPNKKNLELTPEIIDMVLKNYIYHVPNLNSTLSANKIINNYNTVNKFVLKMDSQDKLNAVLEYKNQLLLDFEDGLEDKFEYRVNKLDNDGYKCGYFLTQDDIVKLFDDITKIDGEDIKKINIIFDKAVKRFKLYRSKEWESYFEDMGVKELVSLLKSYFLDNYELYLIRNLHKDNLQINRYKLEEHLVIYYHFIAIFDLMPHIQDYSDKEILGHNLTDKNDHYLADRYLNLYVKEKLKVKIRDKNNIKRQLINIVKENTNHNISELNKVILHILKIDESFKEELLTKC